MGFLDFSEALKKLLVEGKKIQRTGWNGKGMWLKLVPVGMMVIDGVDRNLLPFIVMKTVDDELVPWLASQTDILAEDWRVVA